MKFERFTKKRGKFSIIKVFILILDKFIENAIYSNLC